jgi:hypothetical protein
MLTEAQRKSKLTKISKQGMKERKKESQISFSKNVTDLSPSVE